MQVDDFRSFMDLKTEDDADCIPIPATDTYTFEFRNVSYQYKSESADNHSGTYALRHLNLTLEAGKKLAVVRLNGAGKTTFIKLLLRLYDATEGVILLNGIDIRRFRREDYYRLFAPVFQNVELFAFPIAENVSMSRPADTDSARARDCLVQAGMQEKLENLTDGVDTQLLKIIHDNGIADRAQHVKIFPACRFSPLQGLFCTGHTGHHTKRSSAVCVHHDDTADPGRTSRRQESAKTVSVRRRDRSQRLRAVPRRLSH